MLLLCSGILRIYARTNSLPTFTHHLHGRLDCFSFRLNSFPCVANRAGLHPSRRMLSRGVPEVRGWRGEWCRQDPVPNGKRLPLHDERWEAAGKYGSVGWHTFRHTYRSWLDDTGAPMGVQQKLMRHAQISTTMNVYGNALMEAKREANSKSRQEGIEERIAMKGTSKRAKTRRSEFTSAVIPGYSGLEFSLSGCGG